MACKSVGGQIGGPEVLLFSRRWTGPVCLHFFLYFRNPVWISTCVRSPEFNHQAGLLDRAPPMDPSSFTTYHSIACRNACPTLLKNEELLWNKALVLAWYSLTVKVDSGSSCFLDQHIPEWCRSLDDFIATQVNWFKSHHQTMSGSIRCVQFKQSLLCGGRRLCLDLHFGLVEQVLDLHQKWGLIWESIR